MFVVVLLAEDTVLKSIKIATWASAFSTFNYRGRLQT
jgi:hypothetical protein